MNGFAGIAVLLVLMMIVATASVLYIGYLIVAALIVGHISAFGLISGIIALAIAIPSIRCVAEFYSK